MVLLKVSSLAKSVYYYTLSKRDKDDKNKETIDKIKEIFFYHKERYGYRRITLELRNQGYNVNHKKVYRIMDTGCFGICWIISLPGREKN